MAWLVNTPLALAVIYDKKIEATATNDFLSVTHFFDYHAQSIMASTMHL
jgi:hypothetical protein